ncbi:MAG: hypothetical protein NT165_03730 [Candidatus Falkowbacteria bacterium]|nr:hypothetical protein [Candidatus Falkowbacteria bacterium]
MPVLRDTRVIKDLVLPESGIAVKIKDGLLAGDLEALEGEQSEFKKMIYMITRLIIEWDAEGEDGAKLPVDFNSVNLLGFTDLKFIQDNLSFLKSFLAVTPN